MPTWTASSSTGTAPAVCTTASCSRTDRIGSLGAACPPNRAKTSRPCPIPTRAATTWSPVTRPEFTCLCPLTGQPDFATVRISYVPDQSLVELKSLKLYLWSFRNEGGFHEDMTNRILDDLVAAVAPRRMTVVTDWLVRGGIHTVVEASHPPAGLRTSHRPIPDS